MADLAVLTKPTFDFEVNRVEVMDMATLRRTHRENNIYDEPIRGMYHFQVIERVEALCRKYNLQCEIEEIFAAQNKNKSQPGVSLLPAIEKQLDQPKAVEAHILRRVYTTIRIDDDQTDELTTTLVLAYHQEGLQAAIGPCVKICHNQCILSAERKVADYGKNKVTTEGVFDTIDGWLRDFKPQMREDRERIRRLQNTVVSEQDIYTYIGLLTALRVAHDSTEKSLSDKVDTYPLNQSQITTFTENVLKLRMEKQVITAWDLYNVATELYKPGQTDVPALIPQNGAFADTLFNFCNNKVVQ